MELNKMEEIRSDLKQLTLLLSKRGFKPNSFIEIGSRDGDDTNALCHWWKLNPSNCYIIEAHPECYRYIANYYPQYNSFNIAASNKTEVTNFNAGIIGEEKNIGISSVLTRTLSPFKSNVIEVDGWRMEDFMKQLSIDNFDFMKIDVEGFSLQVLKGFGNKIKKTKYIQMEVETKEVWKNQSYYKEVLKYMKTMGFELLDEIILDQHQNDILLENIKI